MAHMRRKINVKVGWRHRKKFREALKKINFDYTTEYVKHMEESDMTSSTFVVEVCGPHHFTDVICLLLIALGNKYKGSIQKRIDESDQFANTKEFKDQL